MLLSLSIIGIVLSVVLLVFNARKYTSSIYLAGFFFVISYYGLIQYVILFSKSVTLVAVVFVNVGAPTYLIGPFLYLYLRSVLDDSARLSMKDLWHLLPMVVYLAGNAEYLFTAWQVKMDVARIVIHDGIKQVPFVTELGFLYQKLPLLAIYLSRPLLVMGYLLWSVALLIHFRRYGKESDVFHKQQFMIKWLYVLFGFLFILVLSHSLQVVVTFEERNTAIFKTLNLLQAFSAVGLAGLLISPFFFPEILYGLPRLPKVPVEVESIHVVLEHEPIKQKASVSRFETEYLEQIGQKTEKCMAEYQPYLQQDFNLTQLSVLLNIPIHHLASFFREVKQCSFTDYRNEWRIRHSKMLIEDGKTAGMTLEAIGMLSGFLSRNAFLTAFKKVEGITPSEYVNKVKT